MALYHVPALTTLFPVLLTPFQVKIFPNIDAPKVFSSIPRNSCSRFFISCFTVSLTPSINTP